MGTSEDLKARPVVKQEGLSCPCPLRALLNMSDGLHCGTHGGTPMLHEKRTSPESALKKRGIFRASCPWSQSFLNQSRFLGTGYPHLP